MTIEKDKYDLVDVSKLEENEKSTFVKFLLFERQRHVQDIEQIDKTVAYLTL